MLVAQFDYFLKQVLEVQLFLKQVDVDGVGRLKYNALGKLLPFYVNAEVLSPLVILPAHHHQLLDKQFQVLQTVLVKKSRVSFAKRQEDLDRLIAALHSQEFCLRPFLVVNINCQLDHIFSIVF